MDILEYAMQMEKDGETFYRELAKKCHAPGFERILNMLADDEVKHYEMLNKMHQKLEHPELLESEILTKAKNIFAQMKEEKQALVCPPTEEDLYHEALEIERKSLAFYEEKAKEVKDEVAREALNKLAAAEKKHVRLLENLVDFVANPATWLEDAEWYHLDQLPE
ncbi:MAG: rubrerythrin [Nitrospirae bacterium]|nr:MAG: rubrerythrin [Nitrospirota bacterium]